MPPQQGTILVPHLNFSNPGRPCRRWTDRTDDRSSSTTL